MTTESSSTVAAESEAGRVGITLLGLAVQVTGPAYHALLARALGPFGYGLFAWSGSVVDGLALFVILGMDIAVRRFAGHALALGKREDVPRVTGSALRVVAIAGTTLAGAMFMAAPYIAVWQDKPGLIVPLRILAFGPLFSQVSAVLLCGSQAAHDMKPTLYAKSMVQPILLFSFLGIAAYVRPGTASASLAIVSALAITSLVSITLYSRLFSLRATLTVAWRGPADPKMLRFGWRLVLGGVFWMVLARIDMLFFGFYEGPVRVGLFAACLMFAGSLGQLRNAFETVVSSIIPRALAHDDLASLGTSMRRQTRWMAMVAMPMFIVFGGFSDIVLLALGPQFVEGSRALRILMVGQLVSTLCIANLVIPMSGRTFASGATAAACVVLEVALLRVLVPRYGLEGAAVASAIGVASAQCALILQSYKFTGVQPFSVHVFVAVVAGALAIGAGRAVLHAAAGPLLARLLAGVVASGVAYVGALAALGIHPEDRAVIARTVASIRQKK